MTALDVPILVTDRLVLRATRIDDAAALHEAYRDVDLMRWWSSAPQTTLAETAAYLAPRVGPVP